MTKYLQKLRIGYFECTYLLLNNFEFNRLDCICRTKTVSTNCCGFYANAMLYPVVPKGPLASTCLKTNGHARIACDSCMAIGFLTHATCKNVWHKSFASGHCLPIAIAFPVFPRIQEKTMTKPFEIFQLSCPAPFLSILMQPRCNSTKH